MNIGLRWPFLFIFSILLTVTPITTNAASSLFQPLKPKVTPDFHPSDTLEAGLWLELDKAEQDIKHSPKLITDPKLNHYVKSVVCRLSPTYCHDIRVYILRIPYFNASMAPNGMLIVWSGLLLRVDNESQLAAVLGHEMGHYLRRHSLNNFLDRENKTSLSAFLTLGLAAMGAAPISSITNYMLAASFYANSRKQEYEADKYGIQLMANAGYDLNQAANLWDSVIAEDKASKKNKDESHVPFFATHPPPQDRSRKLRHYATELIPTEVKHPSDQKRFSQTLSPLWNMLLKDQILLNQPKRTQYLLTELMHKHRLLGTIHYYKGQLLHQRNASGDMEAAEKEYLSALRYSDAPPETHKELGLLLLKQKRYKQAQQQLKTYLDLVPNAKDKEMIQFYISMEHN